MGDRCTSAAAAAALLVAACALLGAGAAQPPPTALHFLHVPGHICDSDTGGGQGLRDFVGTAEECKAKCAELGQAGCSAFVRIGEDRAGSSGGNTGKCFYRVGELQPPKANSWGDVRDCYIPRWDEKVESISGEVVKDEAQAEPESGPAGELGAQWGW